MELMYEQINNYCKNIQMNAKNNIIKDREMKLKEQKNQRKYEFLSKKID